MRAIVNPDDRPVVRDEDETLWQLAQVITSKDVTLNKCLEIEPPSREANSPVQSRRGREREELMRSFRPASLTFQSTASSTSSNSSNSSMVSNSSTPTTAPRHMVDITNIDVLANEVMLLEGENDTLARQNIRLRRANATLKKERTLLTDEKATLKRYVALQDRVIGDMCHLQAFECENHPLVGVRRHRHMTPV